MMNILLLVLLVISDAFILKIKQNKPVNRFCYLYQKKIVSHGVRPIPSSIVGCAPSNSIDPIAGKPKTSSKAVWSLLNSAINAELFFNKFAKNTNFQTPECEQSKIYINESKRNFANENSSNSYRNEIKGEQQHILSRSSNYSSIDIENSGISQNYQGSIDTLFSSNKTCTEKPKRTLFRNILSSTNLSSICNYFVNAITSRDINNTKSIDAADTIVNNTQYYDVIPTTCSKGTKVQQRRLKNGTRDLMRRLTVNTGKKEDNKYVHNSSINHEDSTNCTLIDNNNYGYEKYDNNDIDETTIVINNGNSGNSKRIEQYCRENLPSAISSSNNNTIYEQLKVSNRSDTIHPTIAAPATEYINLYSWPTALLHRIFPKYANTTIPTRTTCPITSSSNDSHIYTNSSDFNDDSNNSSYIRISDNNNDDLLPLLLLSSSNESRRDGVYSTITNHTGSNNNIAIAEVNISTINVTVPSSSRRNSSSSNTTTIISSLSSSLLGHHWLIPRFLTTTNSRNTANTSSGTIENIYSSGSAISDSKIVTTITTNSSNTVIIYTNETTEIFNDNTTATTIINNNRALPLLCNDNNTDTEIISNYNNVTISLLFNDSNTDTTIVDNDLILPLLCNDNISPIKLSKNQSTSLPLKRRSIWYYLTALSPSTTTSPIPSKTADVTLNTANQTTTVTNTTTSINMLTVTTNSTVCHPYLFATNNITEIVNSAEDNLNETAAAAANNISNNSTSITSNYTTNSISNNCTSNITSTIVTNSISNNAVSIVSNNADIVYITPIKPDFALIASQRTDLAIQAALSVVSEQDAQDYKHYIGLDALTSVLFDRTTIPSVTTTTTTQQSNKSKDKPKSATTSSTSNKNNNNNDSTSMYEKQVAALRALCLLSTLDVSTADDLAVKSSVITSLCGFLEAPMIISLPTTTTTTASSSSSITSSWSKPFRGSSSSSSSNGNHQSKAAATMNMMIENMKQKDRLLTLQSEALALLYTLVRYCSDKVIEILRSNERLRCLLQTISHQDDPHANINYSPAPVQLSQIVATIVPKNSTTTTTVVNSNITIVSNTTLLNNFNTVTSNNSSGSSIEHITNTIDITEVSISTAATDKKYNKLFPFRTKNQNIVTTDNKRNTGNKNPPITTTSSSSSDNKDSDSSYVSLCPSQMARVAAWGLGGVPWKPRQPGQKGLRILCFDGGGTRGVLSIAYLKEIMRRVNSRNNRGSNSDGSSTSSASSSDSGHQHCDLQPHDMFDIICGTSTGGIIAVLLGTQRATVDETEMLYDAFIDKIFGSASTYRLYSQRAKYDERELESLLFSVAGDSLLLDSNQYDCPRVFCVSSDMNAGPPKPVLWCNYNYPPTTTTTTLPSSSSSALPTSSSSLPVTTPTPTKSDSLISRIAARWYHSPITPPPTPLAVSATTGLTAVSQPIQPPPQYHHQGSGICRVSTCTAVRATTAAPTYFTPVQWRDASYCDGAVVANNPAALAYQEARLIYPDVPIELMVSISTGCASTPDNSCSSSRSGSSSGGANDNQNQNHILSTKSDAWYSGSSDGSSSSIYKWYASWEYLFKQLVATSTDTEKVHSLMSSILPVDVYYRFNPVLPTSLAIDEKNKTVLNNLKLLAKEQIARLDEQQSVITTNSGIADYSSVNTAEKTRFTQLIMKLSGDS